MPIFSPIEYPEDVGQEVIDIVALEGLVIDIFGEPVVNQTVSAALNKPIAGYKTKSQVSGAQRNFETDANGAWSAELTDSDQMTADSYYRFTINERVFLKRLPDFPPSHEFNDLEDYN